jgi:hypothetical protein
MSLPGWVYERKVHQWLERVGAFLLVWGCVGAVLIGVIALLLGGAGRWFFVVLLIPCNIGIVLLVISVFTSSARILQVQMLLSQRFNWQAEICKHKSRCSRCGARMVA